MSKIKDFLSYLMAMASGCSLIACLFSLIFLTACEDGVKVKRYDYERGEKAKVMLPKGSSMDIDKGSFVVKKNYDFPYWGK